MEKPVEIARQRQGKWMGRPRGRQLSGQCRKDFNCNRLLSRLPGSGEYRKLLISVSLSKGKGRKTKSQDRVGKPGSDKQRFFGIAFFETMPEEVEGKRNPRESPENNKKRKETRSSEKVENQQFQDEVGRKSSEIRFTGRF
jgi:hypothetical protein